MGAKGDHDPYGIVPESFVEDMDDAASHDVTTIPEALRVAEDLPTTTPREEMDRCNFCGSTRVIRKKAADDHGGRRPEPLKCDECGRHSYHTADDTTIFMTDDRTDAFEWIDEPSDPDERGFTPVLRGVDDETLVEIVIRTYRPWTDGGPSYRDLAEIIPYSRYWVGQRIQEWRNGEHRDLVAEPDTRPTIDATGGRATRGSTYGN